MGGSGGGTFTGSRSPETLRDQVRRAENETTAAAFETDLSQILGELLGAFNGRDVATVAGRLDEIKSALDQSIEGNVDQVFSGSVAKHTYVDGMSDVDSLVFINETDLESLTPQAALEHMEKVVKEALPSNATVSHGRMALTVEYQDGMMLQLLPAIKSEGGDVRVPSSRTDGWSEINPVAFREALTERNQECGGKLVPMIKLAKAINGQLPDTQKLSGYHIESLAISAFRNYDGEKKISAMLPTFFERARDLVLAPIKDRTGQSVHVDAYLGAEGSDFRLAASHLLGRIARRMRNASAAGSSSQWRAVFGFEE